VLLLQNCPIVRKINKTPYSKTKSSYKQNKKKLNHPVTPLIAVSCVWRDAVDIAVAFVQSRPFVAYPHRGWSGHVSLFIIRRLLHWHNFSSSAVVYSKYVHLTCVYSALLFTCYRGYSHVLAFHIVEPLASHT